MILRESQKRQIRRTPYNGRVRELENKRLNKVKAYRVLLGSNCLLYCYC